MTFGCASDGQLGLFFESSPENALAPAEVQDNYVTIGQSIVMSRAPLPLSLLPFLLSSLPRFCLCFASA